MSERTKAWPALVLKKLAAFVTKNTGQKLLALLLSVLLWATVTESRDPARQARFHISPDRIELRGLDALSERGLTLLEADAEDLLPNGVDVRISVPNSRYRSVRAENITVYLDIARLTTAGEQTALVGVELPASATLVSLSPDNASFSLDHTAEMWAPVSLVTSGELPEGMWMSEPKLGLSRVLVSGPRQIVSQIAGARVALDLSSLTESVDTMRSYALVNENGEEIASESLKHESYVSLRVTVAPTKLVPIDMANAFVGSPGRGYEYRIGEVSANYAVVAAPQEVLDDLTYVSMDSVLIEGRTESFIETAQLHLPEGALEISPNAVTIPVLITEEEEWLEFPAMRVRFAGLEDGLDATCTPDRVDVSVRGKKSLTSRLKASDITLYADLSNLGPGEHVVEVTVDLKDAQMYDIVPAVRRVSVTIKE